MQLKKFISTTALPILTEKKTLPSPGFSSIEEEEEFLHHKLQPFSRHDHHRHQIPCTISPVQFAADKDHSETKFLQKKYTHLRNEISRRYKENNNFLELTISQLTINELPQQPSIEGQ